LSQLNKFLFFLDKTLFFRREHLSQEDLRKNRELNKAFSGGEILLDDSDDDKVHLFLINDFSKIILTINFR
jgi:hypothetical protein